MTTPTAQSIVHIKDDRFTVTEWRFSAGAETGWHIHGHDYVIVPLTDGTLGLEEPGGVMKQAALTQGLPYSRRVGVNHNVTNLGEKPLSFLEIEATHSPETDRRREVLHRFTAAWNARDLDRLMECMAQDCTFRSSGRGALPQTGHAAVRSAFAAILARFPEARWEEDRHHVSGATGLSEWRFIGRSPKGRAVDMQGCDVIRFDGDLIAALDSYAKPNAA